MLHETDKMSEGASNDCSEWPSTAWEGQSEVLILSTLPIHLRIVGDSAPSIEWASIYRSPSHALVIDTADHTFLLLLHLDV